MSSNTRKKIDWTSWIQATLAVLASVAIVIGYLFNQRMVPFEMKQVELEKEIKESKIDFSKFKKDIKTDIVGMRSDIKDNRDLIISSNKEMLKVLNSMNIELVKGVADIGHMKEDVKELKDNMNKEK